MAGVKRNGFSIIEILVGINLTMLVISMVFGFYLFFTRFTITMEKTGDHPAADNRYALENRTMYKQVR